jgi:hypothetical protein
MTGAEFENGVNNILDNTPQRGVAGSDGITKTVLKQIVAFFKTLLNDVNAIYDAGLFWRGAWSAATAYNVRDVVSSNGSTYRCKAAHTNQAVTNAAFWELVAAKGESGDQVSNYRGGLLQNSAGELLDNSKWTLNLFDSNQVMVVGSGIGNVNNTKIFNTIEDTIRVEFEYKLDTSIQLLSLNSYNKANLNIDQDYFYLEPSAVFLKKTFCLKNNNSNHFYSKLQIGGWANGNVLQIRNLKVSYVSLSEPIYSNYSKLSSGQFVYDVNNAAKIGVYVNSTVGIVWLNKENIPLQPNGTNISMVVNRPYKWTWALVYNDGVTVVTLPAATVNANTNATFVLTGTAGKTYTIVIYPSV